MVRSPTRIRRRLRSGKILVIVALLVPTLLLIVALVVEGGLSMSMQGELRTLSDTAARVVALKLQDGVAPEKAISAAEDYVLAHSRFSEAPQVSVKIPPSSGPRQGDSDFAEVALSANMPFSLGRMWLPPGERMIRVRSVSGLEDISSGARIIALDSSATPGLSISGAGDVRIQGGVMVNSLGGGVSASGEPVDGPGVAASVNGNARLWADDVQVAGGVDDPAGFQPLLPADRPPLRTQVKGIDDPLADLPVPRAGLGLDSTDRGFARVTKGTSQIQNGNTVEGGWVVLRPGVYDYIEITGGNVRFLPGIFVLKGGKANALTITGGTVDGSAGILFYNTGHDFKADTGWPDVNDDGTNQTGSKFGGILINADAQLHPLADPSSPFKGMLIYQRRENSESMEFQGNASTGSVGGTVYARHALVKISGQGIFNNQFVVGQFAKTGVGNLSIECSEAPPVVARKAFLVE